MIYMDEQNSIKFMVCGCPRGGLKCNHAAALLIHDIRNLSRTETEYQWGKRKTSTFKSLLAVEELFSPTKKYVCYLIKKGKQCQSSGSVSRLKWLEFNGLCWLLRAEPPTKRKLPIPTIKETIYSE